MALGSLPLPSNPDVPASKQTTAASSLVPSFFLPLPLWPIANARFVRMSAAALLDKGWSDFVQDEFARLHGLPAKTNQDASVPASAHALRRLRTQNALLQSLLAQCRRDLDVERDGRHLAQQCHERYLDELRGRNMELEMRVEDLRREILALRYGNESTLPPESPSVELAFDEESMVTKERDDDNRDQGCDEDYDDDDSNKDDDDDNHLSIPSDPSAFTTTALAHLAQSTLNKLNPAMMILHFDDLVLKFDPAPQEVLTVLARAAEVWCTGIPSLAGFPERWGGLFGRYVPEAGEQEFLVSLERAFATASPASRIWVRLLVELYRMDVVGEESVVAWAKADPVVDGGRDLRALCRRFLDFLERETSSCSSSSDSEDEGDEGDEGEDEDDVDEDDDDDEDGVGDGYGVDDGYDVERPSDGLLFLFECAHDCDHDSGCDMLSDEGCGGNISSASSSLCLKRQKSVRFNDTDVIKIPDG